MNKKRLGFSIIIPTYNAAAELKLALESIKVNSRLDNEIIVVVDALKSGGNDAAILAVLDHYHVKILINKNNLGPYGGWNKGVHQAKREWLCFATDDQYFADGWDEALWAHKNKNFLLSGQLVEPGIIPVWGTNLEKDFGHNPAEFQEKEFASFVEKNKKNKVVNDGFFIPLVVEKKQFVKLGGWPVKGEFGTRDAPANDIAFIKKAAKQGLKHKRCLDSFSYHFQGSSWRRKKSAHGISVVIISRPNESKIKSCLTSVKEWVDEIVIVIDSKENGNVAKEAKSAGARIFYRDFDNYSSQKNYAINQAKGDWILSLDADEVVSKNLAKELQQSVNDLSYNGYLIPRENIIFDKKIIGGGWYPDYQLRFFVKDYGQFSKIIHERISVRGSVGKLKNHLTHYNYNSIEGFISRLNRYTTAEAKQLANSGYKFKTADVITKPVDEFLRRFFAEKAWRDGLHGLALSFLMSFYSLVIYLKIWEKDGFEIKSLDLLNIKQGLSQLKKEACWWWLSYRLEHVSGFKIFWYKIIRKLIIWKK